MPSAFSLPCHTSVHLARASITPGIAAIVTSLGGAGWGKVRGACASSVPREKAERIRKCDVEDIDMTILYRFCGLVREGVDSRSEALSPDGCDCDECVRSDGDVSRAKNG